MTQEKENPGFAASGLDGWIRKDLAKSGLTPDNFVVEPLRGEAELNERLGFTVIKDESGNWIKIIDIGGYWIPYPNVPGYYRLKLQREIIDSEGKKFKYLSPLKGLGIGNHAYILPIVEKMLRDYNPDKPIYITEGEKKAAKAVHEGFPTIGLSGVWNFKDSENHFLPELDGFIWKDRTFYIVFDSDIITKHNVKLAEFRLTVELMNRGAEVYFVRLPIEKNGEKSGLDDLLVRYGAEKFRELIQNARLTLELQVEEKTKTGLILSELSRLNNEIVRQQTLKQIAHSLNVNIDAVRVEYQKHIPMKEESQKSESEYFTQQEINQAKELLCSPNILDKMLDLTTRRGYVEEDINKAMLYLSFTSRRLRNSISTIVKGASASGENGLVNSVLALFPKEDVLSYSILTSKALVHFNGDLSHKILFIQKHSGSQSAEYSIRTTLSENEISIALPIKNEATGNFTTIERRVRAVGLVFVETTTSERVHAENQTRIFDLYIDESQEPTERVLEAESEDQDEFIPELEAEAKIWRAAQTLLDNHRVHIPYAKRLVEAFPKDKVRVRRDFKRFLSLIKAHTWLYQLQREKDASGRLIATAEDLKVVLPIAEGVLIQSHKEVSPKLEKVLQIIEDNFGVNQEFAFGELEEKSEFKDRTLRRHLKALEKFDLISHNAKTGKESRYMLLSPLPSMSSMSNFRSKILKTQEKFEDKANCHEMTSMSSKDSDWTGTRDNEDNRGQNNLSSINMNDNDNLDQQKLNEDMRTVDFQERDTVQGELDYFGNKSQPDFEIERITYATGEHVYKVEKLGGDGMPTIRIITPDCAEFGDIERQ